MQACNSLKTVRNAIQLTKMSRLLSLVRDSCPRPLTCRRFVPQDCILVLMTSNLICILMHTTCILSSSGCRLASVVSMTAVKRSNYLPVIIVKKYKFTNCDPYLSEISICVAQYSIHSGIRQRVRCTPAFVVCCW